MSSPAVIAVSWFSQAATLAASSGAVAQVGSQHGLGLGSGCHARPANRCPWRL